MPVPHMLPPTPSNMNSLQNDMSMMSMGPAPSMGAPGAAGVVYINLEMKAVGLKNKDMIGKSDPICYVNVPHPSTPAGAASKQVRKWIVVGTTEVVENSLAPNWAKRVQIPFHFEQHQVIRFVIIDVDNKKTLQGDRLGHCITSLAEIVRNGMLTLKLSSSRGASAKCGDLIVRAHDDNPAGKVRLKLALSGASLDKKDRFGKSDPYYELRQVVGAGNRGTSTLYKSEVIKNNLNPTWAPHSLLFSPGGMSWDSVQLQIIVNDWDKFTPHDLIGEAKFSLAELTSKPSFDLINPKKALKSKSYKNSGRIQVHRADAVELPNFISYLQGGLQLKFVVAVDFTASNKSINDPASLHYMKDPMKPSQYAQALKAVGNVLMGYIPEGYVTALGFGAILPGQGNTPSFDFSLTGDADPRVPGVSGLLAAYEQAVKNVTLAGPTNFAPLIRNAAGMASSYPVTQTHQHFSVLLILTDGAVTDLTETIDAIIDCSKRAPMAIVIVGIGDADFSSMRRLDGDTAKLRSDSGREAKHDIVQFTKFDTKKSVDVIASEVLQEVPQRVVEYMIDAGIQPNPRTY